MPDKDEVSANLGRPLTPSEIEHFDSYLQIARQRLESILGIDLTDESATWNFVSREGYRTVFTDVFTYVSAVRIKGELIEGTWVPKQNDSYRGPWYNSIEFDERMHGERIDIEANWGLGGDYPADVTRLLAGIFGIHERELKQLGVREKRIEDYWIKYSESSTLLASLLEDHAATVERYRQPQGAILHGPGPDCD